MNNQYLSTFLLVILGVCQMIAQEYDLIFDLTLDGSTLAYDTPYGQLGINDHLVMQTLNHGIIISDGTTVGSRVVSSEIDPDHIHSMGVGYSKVYIFTQDHSAGRQLWVYDSISDALTYVKDMGDEVIDHIYTAGDKAILYSWLSQGMVNVWQSDGTSDGTSLLGQVPYEASNISFSWNDDMTLFYPKIGTSPPMAVVDDQLVTLTDFIADYGISIGVIASGYVLDEWLILRSKSNNGLLINIDTNLQIEFESFTNVNHAAIIGDKFCYSGVGPRGVIDLSTNQAIVQTDDFSPGGSRHNTGLAYQGNYYNVSDGIWSRIVKYNEEFNSTIIVHGIADHIPFENPQIIGFGDNIYFNKIDDLDTQFRLVKAAACPETKAMVIDTLADIFARYVAKPILCTIDDKMLVSKYEEGSGFELYRYSPAPNGDGDCYDVTFDCDDTDPTIYPSALDIPNNGIDENCSGFDDADDFTAYIIPNPVSDLLTIDLFDAESADVMLFTIDGRLVTQLRLTSASTDLDMSHLPSGLYVLRFIGPYGKIVTRKMLKM